MRPMLGWNRDRVSARALARELVWRHTSYALTVVHELTIAPQTCPCAHAQLCLLTSHAQTLDVEVFGNPHAQGPSGVVHEGPC